MLIVSQDKNEILNFNNIMNIEITDCDDDGFGIFVGVVIGVDDNYRLLGYYKTEERAKEVVQEIMGRYEHVQYIKCFGRENNCYTGATKDFTYEMPKE